MIKNIAGRISKYFLRTGKAAISDAVKYSKELYGKNFQPIYSVDFWDKYITYHTTSEFGSLDGGYQKHCGPCALTNLVMSINNIGHVSSELSPAEIFSKVSEIGIKSRYYFNMDFMHCFGGTLNLAVRSYTVKILKIYIKRPFKVGFPVPAFPFFLKRALNKGAVVVAMLMYHPLYRNHQVLIYGYEELESSDRKNKLLYFKASDGWSSKPVYIRSKDLLLSIFISVYL